MNWKEFFKPDGKKYLISAAICIFYIVFIFLKPIIITRWWGDDLPIGTVVEVPDTIIDYIIQTPFFVVVSIFGAFEMTPFPMSALTINIILLLTLLWWYFISCLVVFSYDKFKTKL